VLLLGPGGLYTRLEKNSLFPAPRSSTPPKGRRSNARALSCAARVTGRAPPALAPVCDSSARRETVRSDRDGLVVHSSQRDLSDLLRTIGGLLFATGAVVLLVRKSGHQGWSDFARVVVVFVPAAVLYLLAVAREPRERALPWQSALTVAAIVLTPVVLFELLHWVGASSRHLLYDAAVLAVTALLAGYAARRARVSYAALLAGLSFLATWLFVWEKMLNHPSANTFRWLLVAAAAVLLLAASRVARSGGFAAAEIAIAGGIAAVAAGLFGVIVSGFLAGVQSITSSASATSAQGGRLIGALPVHTSGSQHLGWDIYLVIVSVALLGIGSRARARGLGYVGAAGLGAFVISTGMQIVRVQSGRAPTHDVLVWPLVLVILGAGGLVVSTLWPRET
jgi:hypothetical protein